MNSCDYSFSTRSSPQALFFYCSARRAAQQRQCRQSLRPSSDQDLHLLYDVALRAFSLPSVEIVARRKKESVLAPACKRTDSIPYSDRPRWQPRLLRDSFHAEVTLAVLNRPRWQPHLLRDSLHAR